MLSRLTLKDLCLSSIRRTPAVRGIILPAELLEEIECIKVIGNNGLVRLIFQEGRVGLYMLLSDFNRGMCKAAKAGDMALTKFFISRGAKKWNTQHVVAM